MGGGSSLDMDAAARAPPVARRKEEGSVKSHKSNFIIDFVFLSLADSIFILLAASNRSYNVLGGALNDMNVVGLDIASGDLVGTLLCRFEERSASDICVKFRQRI